MRRIVGSIRPLESPCRSPRRSPQTARRARCQRLRGCADSASTPTSSEAAPFRISTPRPSESRHSRYLYRVKGDGLVENLARLDRAAVLDEE
jgi:hypothetical protein